MNLKRKSIIPLNQSIIKCDIDHRNLPDYTIQGLVYLSKYFSITRLIIKRSPSKRGFHIIIFIKEKLTDPEIITMQFCLGSDIYRERLNFIRYLNGHNMKEWNILYKNKKRPLHFMSILKPSHFMSNVFMSTSLQEKEKTTLQKLLDKEKEEEDNKGYGR